MSSTKALRDYQSLAHRSAMAEWDRGVRSTLIVVPTGTGKTVIGSHLVGEHVQGMSATGGKALWLCHREELAFQARDALQAITGQRVALEMGDHRASTSAAPITVAMVQSIGARLRRYDPAKYLFAVVDEAHHATCKSYRKVADHFSNVRRWLGLTATPQRADGVALGSVFDSVAYRMEIGTAIDLGWLVAPRQHIASCSDFDLRHVDRDALTGELNQKQLKSELMKELVLDQMVRKTIAVAAGRQTIVFCQTVSQAREMTRIFAKYGERAVSIDGKLPTFIRRQRVAEFRGGQARYLCQVAICTEGFDVPEAEVIAMGRPTSSRTVYTQAVGRVLRPHRSPEGLTPTQRRLWIATSPKPWATVIDFVGNTGKHTLCNTGDLLGGDYPDEVRRVAMELAQKQMDQDVDILGLLEQAKAIVIERNKNRELMEGATGKSQDVSRCTDGELYSRFSFLLSRQNPHPFDVLKLNRVEAEKTIGKDDAYGASLSDATKKLEAARMQLAEIGRLTNREVVFLSRFLDSDRRRLTYRQAVSLYKHGYDPSQMSREAASRKLDQIAANGYRRPEEDGPNEYLRAIVRAQIAARMNER